MKTEKETLSDKRLIRPVSGKDLGVYLEKDVKESIENLKEIFCTGRTQDTIAKRFCSKGDYIYCDECAKIDNEVGDKLI